MTAGMTNAPVVAIGEGMLEISRGERRWRLAYGGDTLNTAVYLSRLGVPTSYLTALGDDPFSSRLRAQWQREGVDVSSVLTCKGLLPGLYAICRDPTGERTFHYWRRNSAARRLFNAPEIAQVTSSLASTPLVYLSGITLSLYAPGKLRKLVDFLTEVRRREGAVAFDPNYRAKLWPTVAAARRAIKSIAELITCVLPTDADELQLYGTADPKGIVARWQSFGVHEIVIKMGSAGCIIATGRKMTRVAANIVEHPRDTTGAGDSFNAAYLAARLGGAGVARSAAAGNALASTVIRHPGAIIPRSAMPAIPVPSRARRYSPKSTESPLRARRQNTHRT